MMSKENEIRDFGILLVLAYIPILLTFALLNAVSPSFTVPSFLTTYYNITTTLSVIFFILAVPLFIIYFWKDKREKYLYDNEYKIAYCRTIWVGLFALSVVSIWMVVFCSIVNYYTGNHYFALNAVISTLTVGVMFLFGGKYYLVGMWETAKGIYDYLI